MSKSIEEEFLTDVEIKTHSKRRKSINSKQKGNSFERNIAKLLTERFGKEFRRTVSSGAYTGGLNVKNAEFLTESQLLVFVSDIRTPEDFKFSIECKSYKSIDFYDLFNKSSNLYSWYKQSETDAKLLKRNPLLIVKTNNHKPIVFVKISDAPQPDKLAPVFIHEGRCVYWLEDLLTLSESYFFSS